MASRSRSPLAFFLLVFALSTPFWLIGGATRLRLLPGLSVSALMAFCPLMAASLLVYRTNNGTGVVALLKRSFDSGKSVFGAALFHAGSNTSWQLFPNYGSHFDPRIAGLFVAFTAALVAAIWGPRTLARFRNT